MPHIDWVVGMTNQENFLEKFSTRCEFAAARIPPEMTIRCGAASCHTVNSCVVLVNNGHDFFLHHLEHPGEK